MNIPILASIGVIVTGFDMKLDSSDVALLGVLQRDSKKTAKDLGRDLDMPVTTVYAKIKRMEEDRLHSKLYGDPGRAQTRSGCDRVRACHFLIQVFRKH